MNFKYLKMNFKNLKITIFVHIDLPYEMHLLSYNCPGVEIQLINIFLFSNVC